jgi:hypothetical protein
VRLKRVHAKDFIVDFAGRSGSRRNVAEDKQEKTSGCSRDVSNTDRDQPPHLQVMIE